MYVVTGDSQYMGHAQAFVNSYKPGGGITYTPAGLAWRDTWGPNRYAGMKILNIAIYFAFHG